MTPLFNPSHPAAGAAIKPKAMLICGLISVVLWGSSIGSVQDAAAQTAATAPTIEADELRVDPRNNQTEAHGDVIVTTDKARLNADHLIFSGQTIEASGHVIVSDAQGRKLSAEKAELNKDLTQGALYQAKIELEDTASLRAHKIDYTEGAQTILQDARYTACALCENAEPQWQIHSSQTTHDTSTQTISSWHNRVEIAGVPVLYLPYLAHPSPGVAKRSGFLAPQIGNDGRLGAFITTPYFFDLAPNYDLTLQPKMTRNEGVVMEADWRHLTPNGRYNFSVYGNSPQDELARIDGDHDFRGGITGSGKFETGATAFGFSIQEPTDDLFFDRYRINDATTLANSFNLTHGYSDHSGEGKFRIDMGQYRYLNDTVSQTRVHDIAPYVQHIHDFKSPIAGGNISWLNSVKHSRRDFGLNLTELSSQVQWTRRHAAQNGTVWTMTNHTEVNHFTYHSKAGQTQPDHSDDESYLSNVAALNAEYPLIRFGPQATQRITPRLQVIAVASDSDLAKQYLRSDVARDLSASDLFQINSAGSELSRANMGIAYAIDHRSGVSAHFFVGQSFNLDNDEYATATGYGARESNLVTEAQINYRGLSVSNMLRIDQTGGDILRHRSSVRLDTAYVAVQAQYNFYEQGQIGAQLEEMNIEGELKLAKRWFLRGKRHENLETNQIVREYAGLSYRDECTDIELRYTKDNTQIGAVPPSSSVMLFINLKTLGGISR